LKIYKIRNAKGEFSSGGAYPHFKGIGKTWRNVAALKLHLSMAPIYSKDCVVVEYDTVETGTRAVTDMQTERKQLAAAKEEAIRQRSKEARERAEKKEYERLRVKFAGAGE
jgi:hypothetical protein